MPQLDIGNVDLAGNVAAGVGQLQVRVLPQRADSMLVALHAGRRSRAARSQSTAPKRTGTLIAAC